MAKWPIILFLVILMTLQILAWRDYCVETCIGATERYNKDLAKLVKEVVKATEKLVRKYKIPEVSWLLDNTLDKDHHDAREDRDIDYEENGIHLFQYQKNIIEAVSIILDKSSSLYEESEFSIVEFNSEKAWTCKEFLHRDGCFLPAILNQLKNGTFLGIQMDENSDRRGKVEKACLLGGLVSEYTSRRRIAIAVSNSEMLINGEACPHEFKTRMAVGIHRATPTNLERFTSKAAPWFKFPDDKHDIKDMADLVYCLREHCCPPLYADPFRDYCIQVTDIDTGAENFDEIETVRPMLSSNILITNGFTDTGGVMTDNIQILDLSSSTLTCDDFPVFPEETACSVGDFLPEYNVPFVCTKDGPCYSLTKDGHTQTSALVEQRSEAASIVLDDGSLLVAGGGNAYPFFATTEIVAPGMDSIPGPDMPGGPNRFHCFIKYGPTKALLIGGGTGPASIARFALDETWVFDVPTRTFLGPGPSLNTPRRDLACGVIMDTVTGGEYIVVAGGQLTSPEILDSTEILDLNDIASGWIETGPMPAPYEEGEIVRPTLETLVYAGGKGSGTAANTLLELTCANKACVWTTLPITMAEPRHDFVTLSIPDELVNCA